MTAQQSHLSCYKAQVLVQAMANGISLCRRSQAHGGTLQHGSHDVVGNDEASRQARISDHLLSDAEAHDIAG